jgi:hypothetical protein
VLANAFEHFGKAIRRGRRSAVVVAHVQVNQRGTRLEGFVRRFDLLVDRDGNRGIVLLSRQRSGDRDGDDARCSHGDLDQLDKRA